MAVCVIIGVFAVENVAEILVDRFAGFAAELVMWSLIAMACAIVIYEVGEDRGDW